MKLRADSPFAVLSEVERGMILEVAESASIDELVYQVNKINPEIEFSIPALKRFVRRLKEEALREEVTDSNEAMEELAKAGASGRARDGVLEAMRRQMFAQALEAKDTATAMMVFRMMREEQKEDRAMRLEERRVAIEEETAKQEWRRQELSEARSALRLLPTITAILMEEGGTAEEKVARARECLGAGGARL